MLLALSVSSLEIFSGPSVRVSCYCVWREMNSLFLRVRTMIVCHAIQIPLLWLPFFSFFLKKIRKNFIATLNTIYCSKLARLATLICC